jgi:hypothetical protein
MKTKKIKYSQIEKIEKIHNTLIDVLRENGNEEYGDCIIDDICTLFGKPTTIDLHHLKIESAIVGVINDQAKETFGSGYDDSCPMDLIDCLAYFLNESLYKDIGFDSDDIHDFVQSKLRN